MKLTDTGHSDPRLLPVDSQPDPGNQNDNQQEQAEDVESRCEIQQTAIVSERNREHRHETDREPDQLLDPVGLSWLRVANLDRAEQNDGDRHEGEEPVEVAPTAFVNNCNH